MMDLFRHQDAQSAVIEPFRCQKPARIVDRPLVDQTIDSPSPDSCARKLSGTVGRA
jgi:hypothetical protein